MRGLAVALGLILLTNAAGAADPTAVRTRGGLHPAYGRLVFDWNGKVGYEAEVEGSRLKVTFDRPFTSSFSDAESRLAGYIGKGELSGDARTVTFPLRRPVSPKAFVVKQSVVVDLYHSSEPGPVWGERTPPAALAVKVRAGEHPTYTRFVFDWPKSAKYEVSGSGDDTLLAFGKPARLDTDGLTKKFVRLLDAGGADTSDIVSAVRFSVPADRTVRHFRLGDRVVVDLMKGAKPAPAVAENPPETPASGRMAEAERPELPASDDSGKKTNAAAEVEKDVGPSRSAELAKPLPNAPAKEAKSATRPAVTPTEPASAEKRPRSQPVAETVSPAAKPHRPTGTAFAAGSAPPAAPMRVVPPPVVPASRANLTTAASASEAGAETQEPVVEVGFARTGESYSLSFPGLGGARASVFSRAGGAWMVFDQSADLRLDRLKDADPELARGATVLSHPSATVLRLQESAERGLIARREGTAWVVDVGKSDRPPYRPLSVTAEPMAAPGAGLVIAAERPGEPIPLTDPEAGDRLVIVPLPEPDTGLPDMQEYPEVQLLATAQGVAVAQRGDGLLVSSDDDRIRITTSAGLLLSRVPETPAPEAMVSAQPDAVPADSVLADSADAIPRLLDLARWQRPEESFTEARRALEAAVLEADAESVDAARLDLVRFYLARGLAAEALGALEAAGPEAASTLGGPLLHALRGAANLLAHRFEAAETDLFHPDLDASAEAAVWRGALHAMRGDSEKADPLFEQGWPVVAGYPKWLRQELALRAAEAALDRGEEERASEYLTAAAEQDAPHAVQSRAQFLKGRVLAERGEALDALAAWSTVAGGADQMAHARAELAAVRLELKEGLIDHQKAIERLERLRFAWRGDALEFEMLELLGRSYLAAGDYANGFATLREAVTLFAETLDTAPATELMTQAFRRLFVDGEMRDLPPLKAVSLYQEYRELTPIGEEGDGVVRDLAARLVSLDLLEPAAELLDNQVRYRLQGERRARSAADLALIHLLDRKPSAAVEVLRMSAVPGLPEDLASRRRHMLARGLWDMGKPDEALGVIASDASREADSLRADIYWKAARWADAAEAYARMAGGLDAAEMSGSDGRLVLKWGVALTLGRDAAGVRQLEQKYGKAMAGSPHGAAFRMITAGRPASGASLATITETLADVDDFQTYLKGYRSALEGSATLAGVASKGTS